VGDEIGLIVAYAAAPGRTLLAASIAATVVYECRPLCAADNYPVVGALPAGPHTHRPHLQRVHNHRRRHGALRHRLCAFHRHKGKEQSDSSP